jgi:hypothetical protein
MKYAIDTSGEFLHVRVWDREEDRPPSELCRLLFQESRRLGRDRILIELDQKAALSPTSQHMLVSRLPDMGFTVQDRIALVHRTPEMQRANEFINVIADNRGVMVRNFGDLEDAKAWLRKE